MLTCLVANGMHLLTQSRARAALQLGYCQRQEVLERKLSLFLVVEAEPDDHEDQQNLNKMLEGAVFTY